MIISTSLILGFKNQIKSKIFDFWGHIHLSLPEYNQAVEPKPLTLSDALIDSIKQIGPVSYSVERTMFKGRWFLGYNDKTTKGGVHHLQGFVQLPGIVTAGRQIEGLVLKGVSEDFDTSFISKYLVAGSGTFLNDSSGRSIMVSQTTANRLELSVNDDIIIYFVVGGNQVGRRFSISGIYKTGLEEYDRKFALCDAGVLQQLLGWADKEFSGYEVFVDHLDDLEVINDYLYIEILPQHIFSTTIRTKFPGIFEWLELQDYNEVVILGLMVAVCLINMATVLIIFILTRMKMIGILKTLGMRNKPIRRIFLIQAMRIILYGLLWGNFVGLGLSWLQYHYKFLRLNEEDYYLSIAPIEFSMTNILLINLGSILIVMVFLIIPSWLVSKITPVKTIAFN